MQESQFALKEIDLSKLLVKYLLTHLSLSAAQGAKVWKSKDLGSFPATQQQHLQDPNRSFLPLSQPLPTQTSLIKAAWELVHLHETVQLCAALTSFAFSLKPMSTRDPPEDN